MVRLTLDEYMKKHGISRYELAKRTEVPYPTLNRYYKNRVVRYDNFVLDRICFALGCEISDIIEYTDDRQCKG